MESNIPSFHPLSLEEKDIKKALDQLGISCELEIKDRANNLFVYAERGDEFYKITNDLIRVFSEHHSDKVLAREKGLEEIITLDLGDEYLFSYLISLVLKILNAEVALMQIIKEPGTIQNISMGIKPENIRQIQYKGVELPDYMEKFAEILLVPDVESDEDIAITSAQTGFIRSLLAVPILYKNKVVAVLYLINKNYASEFSYFSTEDKQLLAGLSSQIGVTITNALLYRETIELKGFNEEVLENIPSGVLITSQNGVVIFHNAYLRQLLDKIWLSETELLQTIDADHVQSFLHREFNLSKNEQRLFLRVSKRDLQIGTRAPVFLYSINDITQEKDVEQQLRKAERLAIAGELMAGVAHEIKNPLTAMRGFSDLIWQRIDDKDFVLKFAGIVSKEIERLNHIIERFQSFARPQAEEMQALNLRELIEEVRAIIAYHLKRDGVHFENQVSEEFSVYGSRELLMQVFLNLSLNAVQALATVQKDDKRVTFRVEEKEKSMELTVEDNGPGISFKSQQKIFDPFFTTKPKGSGLGLSITHRIMEEHQGRIDLQTREGEYTRFILTFPRHRKKTN